MDISINAKVKCSDGPYGRSTGVIIKPITNKVTHLVIREETIPVTEYLISIGQVVESTSDEIGLCCSREELLTMPIFSKMVSDIPIIQGFPRTQSMMWSYIPPAIPYTSLEKEPFPADELSLRRGAWVDATDGHVGRVYKFLINTFNNQITNLVMREDYLWGQNEVTIPVGQIDHYKNNTVYLKMNKQQIEKIPKISVRHK